MRCIFSQKTILSKRFDEFQSTVTLDQWPLCCSDSWVFSPIYMPPCISTKICYSSRIMYHVIRPKLPRISFRSILEISKDKCDHKKKTHMRIMKHLYDVVERSIKCEILHLQILRSCWQLSTWHNSTFPKRFSCPNPHSKFT